MASKSAPRTATPPAPSAPCALVTGASSGIGEALAECFAANGYDLILVARSAEKLQALSEKLAADHGVKAYALAADLSVPGAAATLAQTVAKKRLQVEVLVNCAGVLHQGAFSAISASTHQQMIDLNISGLTAIVASFLPALAERASRGHPARILNVASIAAFQPIAMLATYAATKAYVLSLGEALAEELKEVGVTVTTLCPGVTATAMLSSAASANSKVGQIPDFMIGQVDGVASQAIEACLRGDALCVPGAFNQALVVGSRAAPKWLVRKLGGLLARKAL